jgi:hypothetical protein
MIKVCLSIKIIILGIFIFAIEPVLCEEDKNTSPNEISYKIYLTKKGDTLTKIAGSPDLYGSELKWPLIYSLNRSELNFLKEEDVSVEDRILPIGINLAILLPHEAKKSRLYVSLCEEYIWVINVSSSINKNKINKLASNLIESDYFVYFTLFDYEKKKYLRLRVGFYPSKEEAELDARVLRVKLDMPDIWVTRAKKDEIAEFVGFFGTLSP